MGLSLFVLFSSIDRELKHYFKSVSGVTITLNHARPVLSEYHRVNYVITNVSGRTHTISDGLHSERNFYSFVLLVAG